MVGAGSCCSNTEGPASECSISLPSNLFVCGMSSRVFLVISVALILLLEMKPTDKVMIFCLKKPRNLVGIRSTGGQKSANSIHSRRTGCFCDVFTHEMHVIAYSLIILGIQWVFAEKSKLYENLQNSTQMQITAKNTFFHFMFIAMLLCIFSGNERVGPNSKGLATKFPCAGSRRCGEQRASGLKCLI